MSAVSTQTAEVREAHFQDYQGIAALEASRGLVHKPQDEWRRLWAGNPSYEDLGPRWPIGWVLEDDGRIVGSLTNIPIPYALKGKKLLAAAGHHFAVEPPYRRYASELINQYLAQENVDVFLTNAANAESTHALSASGSLRIPVGDWSAAAYTITEPRGFVASTLRSKHIPFAGLLSYPVGLALALKERFAGPAIPQSSIDVAKARDFDQRFETFWEILSNRSDALLAVRSRAVLKWHFGPSIDKNRLWVLIAARNSNIDAYSVFERCDDAQSGLKRMRMVDFQACDWPDQYCAAFMRRAFNDCRAEGIHVLEHIGCQIEKTRIFDQASPYRRSLPNSSLLYLTKNQELAEHLSHPEAWAPSSYDACASL